MDHLFNSVVRVERLQLTVLNGVAQMAYAQATDPDPTRNSMLNYLKCRLDLNFVRPGKDVPAAPVAGRAPDRIGVLLTYPNAPIKAGDRLVTIPNEWNEIPVEGAFELRTIPDEVVSFSSRHHLEAQILEAGQELSSANWPSEDPIEDVIP